MMRLEDTSLRYRLKNAIFIVLENILASGYGLFIPEKDGHIIFNSILMIIGRFIVCYMLSKALYDVIFVCQKFLLSMSMLSFSHVPSYEG